jgi:hypothetical protein
MKPKTANEISLKASAMAQVTLALCELDKRKWVKENGGI